MLGCTRTLNLQCLNLLADVLQQQRRLQERLQHQREQRLKALSAKHLLKQRDFLRRVDKVTETGNFVIAYITLINQQAEDREGLILELDMYEEQEIASVREVRKTVFRVVKLWIFLQHL